MGKVIAGATISPETLTAEHIEHLLVGLAAPGGPTTAHPGFRCDTAGDLFLNIPMRAVFGLAKQFMDLELDQVEELLASPIHEVRVAAVSVMDFQARHRSTPPAQREALYRLYLRRHDRIDNWDLVDRAAPSVVGGYLHDKPREPLYRLARSGDVWQRRTAIVATYHFLRHGELDDTYAVAEILVHDPHDLVQKAVGGWLREAGRHDPTRLRAFLDTHAAVMPRTALRYAIERLSSEERRHYRGLNGAVTGIPTVLPKEQMPCT